MNTLKKNYKSGNAINEILFYGAEDEKRSKELGLINLCCIYYLLAHANRNIDMCVPSLVSDAIIQCLTSSALKKVKIRVAIHKSHNFCHLDALAQNGIEVKVINSGNLNHEFALIDAGEKCKNSLAVIGPLDYDITKVNKDHTLLTSESKVLIALKKEFERVWASAPNFHKKDN